MRNAFLILIIIQLKIITYAQSELIVAHQDFKHFPTYLSYNFSKNKNEVSNIKLINGINTTDSIISLVVSQINADSVRYFIQNLQDFQTRYLYAANREEVANWIKNEFLRFGIMTVELDSFYYDGTLQHNIVATIQGRINFEQFVIIGGHYDSYSDVDPMNFAPGADDDASGTAAALEIARVLLSSGYIPDVTVKFIAFAAEELGMWGSKHYAEFAVSQNMDIKIMLNNDMISYTPHAVPDSKLSLAYGSYLNIRTLAENFCQNYSVLTPILTGGTGPDAGPFAEAGYKTLSFMEYDFNPYYHTSQETIDKCNIDYCAEVIKVNAAVLLKIADMPVEVKELIAEDVGDGNSVRVIWNENQESDVIGYNIFVGTSAGNYDSTIYTENTLKIVSGLIEGVEYFIGVSAKDIDGNASFIVEKSITPNSTPLIPINFVDHPQWHQIMFDWSSNKELDLLGYNLYRSETGYQDYIKINQSIIIDTFFTDNNTISGKYYYYLIKAVDNELNESNPSEIIRSMAVSLDKGILLVDETKNGSGNLFSPTDQQVDEFYDSLLSAFNINDYDIESDGELKLADIGAYSTIIWQGNDYTNYISALNAKESIKQYMNYGGNFLFTGFSVSQSFHGSTGLLSSFTEGDFIFDYLKIDTVINKLSALFISASPIVSSYNFIFVDSSKSSLTINYHLRKIESISANSEALNIYSYNSGYDSTTIQGSMQDLPIAVEYLGTDYKSIVLNIPLYYMNLNQAKLLMEYIIQYKFNEPTDIEDENKELVLSKCVLEQNYPNPFNPSTIIEYSIPVTGNVKLAVYNLIGEEVAVLVNGQVQAGFYEVTFDASNLSSGMYLYKMQAGNSVEVKKMILIK